MKLNIQLFADPTISATVLSDNSIRIQGSFVSSMFTTRGKVIINNMLAFEVNDLRSFDKTFYPSASQPELTTIWRGIWDIIGNRWSATLSFTYRYYVGGQEYPGEITLTRDIVVPPYSFNASVSAIDRAAGTYTTNYDRQGKRTVSSFTYHASGSPYYYYLEGWSKPRVSWTFTSTAGYNLYPGPLYISGDIVETGGLGTYTLDVDDVIDKVYTVSASDGRRSTSTGITINKIAWSIPSFDFSIQRDSSLGRDINWSINADWSYISPFYNGLQPKLHAELAYNNITYILYSKNNAYYWYDGTHLYEDTTGDEITSFDISEYDDGIVITYPDQQETSSLSVNGVFKLLSASDYKYSITGSAHFTDNIDYRVYSNKLLAPGLPAIYTHKDSNANNLINIYGNTTIDGVLASKGIFTTGNIDTQGTDIYFGTTPNTDDSGDIVFKYGNGNEKSRIWTDNIYSVGAGPQYRVYDVNGNLLYNGRLGLDNKYSTNEVIIGNWVDGEPLYRRIFTGYFDANGAMSRVYIGGKIRRIDGYATSVHSNTWKIGSHYFPEPQYDTCFTLDTRTDNHGFEIETNGYFANSYYYAIVEYTK